MQMVDVVLRRSGVHDAELDVIAEVAVMDVRRIIRIERLGRLPPNAPAGGVCPGARFSRPTLAGTSTTMAGSPSAQEVRKNSSYLQSVHSAIGPTPRRLARISAPMPPVP